MAGYAAPLILWQVLRRLVGCLGRLRRWQISPPLISWQVLRVAALIASAGGSAGADLVAGLPPSSCAALCAAADRQILPRSLLPPFSALCVAPRGLLLGLLLPVICICYDMICYD